MASELILMAEPRTALGKKNKALRRTGMVPGVVYGPAVEGTVQVAVPRKEFERFFQTHGHTALITLKWDGGSQKVMIKEVQVEPVKRAPLHIDFFAPNLRKELTSSVPVVVFNHNPAALGMVNQVLSEVAVRSLPASVPNQINADVSGLVSLDDELRAGDLELPEGVTLVTDADAVVAAVVPTMQEEAAPAEEPDAGAVPVVEAETTEGESETEDGSES